MAQATHARVGDEIAAGLPARGAIGVAQTLNAYAAGRAKWRSAGASAVGGAPALGNTRKRHRVAHIQQTWTILVFQALNAAMARLLAKRLVAAGAVCADQTFDAGSRAQIAMPPVGTIGCGGTLAPVARGIRYAGAGIDISNIGSGAAGTQRIQHDLVGRATRGERRQNERPRNRSARNAHGGGWIESSASRRASSTANPFG
jgi:hypothetical protein